ncbi:amino acid adenylation domain-containing protein, partial [Maribacter sp. 2307UL18-2]|uniref:amino acid adenylation domain-containing protein n=1 Tax=Maribacter sp. 2307UL18-2 TaxID=3386274 RepID=UPI0039BC4E58
YNDTAVAYPLDRTVIDLFEDQVEKAPDNVAVSYLSSELSYISLDSRSSHLAFRLFSLGLAKGDRVGILMEPSDDLLVAVLGVLKSGCAFVPIDTVYPSARKGHMISDSGMKALISTVDLIADNEVILEGIAVDNRLDMGSLDFEGDVVKSRLPVVSSEDLAYVLYTSGSTGLPKGVMISHGALFNYMSWAGPCYMKEEQCPMALFSSISFDLTITSMFLPLLSGNELRVYNGSQDGQAMLLEQVILDGHAKVLKLTPSHLRVLKESDLSLKGIRRFIVGGEQLTCDLASAINSKGSTDLEIYNEYGPTEATIGCVVHRYRHEDSVSGKNVPIGRPTPNSTIYILDSNHQLLPEGVAGELHIGGAQLFKGYIGSPSVTDLRRMENPYKEGEFIYRTGDLVKWLPEGVLEFIGRVDDQVKVRGHRIELGEIESQLLGHEMVKEGLVLFKGEFDSGYLVGYYVSEQELFPSDLEEHLSLYLPEYMLPKYYVQMDSFPLT